MPVALVVDDPSPDAAEMAAGFQLSPYLSTRCVTSMPEAQALMLSRQGGRHRPRTIRFRAADCIWADAEVQILVHGTDANRARIIQGYAQGAIGQWSARGRRPGNGWPPGRCHSRNRLWFNEANDSHYFSFPD